MPQELRGRVGWTVDTSDTGVFPGARYVDGPPRLPLARSSSATSYVRKLKMWTVLLTSFATSVTSVAFATFILKKLVDHRLKLHAIDIEARTKAEVAEAVRRQARLYDEQ